jgi:type IV pilus assembly protein PilW
LIGGLKAVQAGSSLVALMVSLTLSLGIVLSALRAVTLAGTDYLRSEQYALLQDQAAYVLDAIMAVIQQAGHVDATRAMPALPARPLQGALKGLDDVVLSAGSPGLDAAGAGSGSDALAVRTIGDALGRSRNCAGLSVPAPSDASDERGVSIFHVVPTGPQGEPELHCKYRGSAGWVSQAIATGVESLQLRYGIDPDGDGLPNDFVSASRLQTLESVYGTTGVSLWTRVVAVQIALLLRSPQAVHVPAPARAFELFGSHYADRHATDDPGTRRAVGKLQPGRLYREFNAVIFLGNRLSPQQ